MAREDVNVVLVRGAWAGGSSWAAVIAALKEESVKVSAAPLPLTSLADDVAALDRSLDRTTGPIVLAGHAYAGAVIALARPDRVKALIYVTALAPDDGEKVADVFYRGCAAADIGQLHHGSCRAPALEGHSELVSHCRRRPNDRLRDAALHGGAHEGEDNRARGRSHAQRHRSSGRRRHYPRCCPLRDRQPM
jgi:pimeloyl-ACP methyl ester carboxylesterase